MPEIPRYDSRLGLPSTGGAPVVPGGFASIYGGLGAASQGAAQDFGQLSSIVGAQESVARDQHATTLADSLYDNMVNALDLRERERRDPGRTAAEFATFDPLERISQFDKDIQEISEATRKEADRRGGNVRARLESRIGNILSQRATKFHGDMLKMWRESDDFKFSQTIENSLARAVQTDDLSVLQEERRWINERLSERVRAGLLTQEKGLALSKDFDARAVTGYASQFINQNWPDWMAYRAGEPVESKEQAYFDQLSSTFPTMMGEFDKIAEQAAKERSTRDEFDKRESTVLRETRETANFNVLLDEIGNNTITSKDKLFSSSRVNFPGKENYRFLESLIEAKTNGPSDPESSLDLWARLSSPNPRVLPSQAELETYKGKLSHTELIAMTKRLGERLEHFKTQATTVYDKQAQEGEQNLRNRLQIGLPMMATLPEAKLAEARAVKEFNDLVFLNRGKADLTRPDAPNPLDWVETIYQRHIVPLTRSGKVVIETEVLRRSLPQGWEKPENVVKMFNEGRIDARQFVNTMTFLDTLRRIEEATTLRRSPESNPATGRPTR